MRRKGLVLALAVAAIPTGVALANSDGLKVTGGGQVVASADQTGPGDTIAFNAQQNGPADSDGVAPAKGQLQVVDRLNNAKFHGDVTCIRSFTSQQNGESYTRFGGYQKVRGQSTATPFTVDAQDNGEGANATGDDMILFRRRAEGDDPCDTSDESTDLRSTTLARGNVQQH